MKKISLQILISLCCFLTMLAAPVHAQDNVSIRSVTLSTNKLYLQFSGVAKTDDNRYYLYMQEPFEKGTEGKRLTEIASDSDNVSMTLHGNEAYSMMYKRYTICGYLDGKMEELTRGKYVTRLLNLARHTTPRFLTGKKGVLLSAEMVADTQYLYELNSCQVIYNVLLGDLCTDGDIPYTYNGKTYYYNSSIAGQYDHVLQTMEDFNVQTTFVLLNNRRDNALTHPDPKDGTANYYAFNTSTKEGVDSLAAVTSFLAERYSGGKYGTVDNWIIGNEVNVRDWNYLSPTCTMRDAVQAYADAFRIAYTSIKAQNDNARIYISLDNEWTAHNPTSYAGRDFLETFADKVKIEGDIDWNVAIHPYNYPLTSTDCQNQIGHNGVANDINTTYLTMQNINVLTEYLHKDRFLTISKDLRSVLCSEQGYTSSGPGGEEAQAAAILYAYEQASKNPDIDGFLLNRQQDAAEEVAQGLALGLMREDGSKKLSYEAYKNAE